MKNYIGFVNDHSGSMGKHVRAAVVDYNANITAVKDAASREMLDTVVSVVGIGLGKDHHGIDGYGVKRQVQVSNPHVLKPITNWPTPGGTPLYDGIGDMIELLQSLPDADNSDVSFLVMTTTDGEEAHSYKYSKEGLAAKIAEVSATGRWTFVLRVPKNGRMDQVQGLGIPVDNIQTWDTSSAEGMTATTQANTQAMSGYFACRTAGAKATGAFYANAAQVDITALKDVTSEISLYVVPTADNGIEIRPFILRHRMKHLKGAAFYQLTKTESKVQHDKQVLVRDRASGKIFAGAEARKMIGLPVGQNARLHPGDHKNFDLFIQSNSINRKLVANTGVAYWDAVGTEFTASDLEYLGEKSPFYVAPAKVAAPAVIQLPVVQPTNRPTPSPIPVTPMRDYFETREDARLHCGAFGIVQSEIQKHPGNSKERRWSTPRALQRKSA